MSGSANDRRRIALETLRQFRYVKKAAKDACAVNGSASTVSDSGYTDSSHSTKNKQDVLENRTPQKEPEPMAVLEEATENWVLDNDDFTLNAPNRKKLRQLGDEFEHSPPDLAKRKKLDFRDDFDETTLETNMEFLQDAFPNKDATELQEALLCSNNDLEIAMEHITSGKGRKKKVHTQGLEADEDDDDFHMNTEVYDSDDSDGEECPQNKSNDRMKVLKFLSEGTVDELAGMPGCSGKKAEVIVALRPFEDWDDLVGKISNAKYTSTELLNSAKQFLHIRESVRKLMLQCEKLSKKMEMMVSSLMNYADMMIIKEQPKCLNSSMHLTSYQLLGLNWLWLMYDQELNGVLADEMGLGKTIQTVAFLAYLQEQGIGDDPNLIVVPASTLENWERELKHWCPSLTVQTYLGPLNERRILRNDIFNRRIDNFDVLLTTYNMIQSPEDRALFKKYPFHYVVFDEAHMLKNMCTMRYEALMKVKASRRLLLTGTPLQNSLVELMSILIFVMPQFFGGIKENLRHIFSIKCGNEVSKSQFETERIVHAQRIMKPFFLRRLKCEVLKDLPLKTEHIVHCILTPAQQHLYDKLINKYTQDTIQLKKGTSVSKFSGMSMMMNLRKASCHPLLLRNHYTDDGIIYIADQLKKEPAHANAEKELLIEDLHVMTDFEIHRLCKNYERLQDQTLTELQIVTSAKMKELDRLLPAMQMRRDRVLIFSQFVILLDILQEYIKIRGYKFLRLDGQTPVSERQMLIDDFTNDSSIFVFLLSTRAGGLGINLAAANAVIIHDIDFNPYNDKQAEDRSHRVGQTKEVSVYRLITSGTIEEGMLKIASEKLRLERDLANGADDKEDSQLGTDSTDVASLLRQALGIEI